MTFKNLSEFVAAQGRCAEALMNHIVAFATALASRPAAPRASVASTSTPRLRSRRPTAKAVSDCCATAPVRH